MLALGGGPGPLPVAAKGAAAPGLALAGELLRAVQAAIGLPIILVEAQRGCVSLDGLEAELHRLEERAQLPVQEAQAGPDGDCLLEGLGAAR